MSGAEKSCSTEKLLLENIVKLYLRVRSFSYAKDYISKYKIKGKQTKSKAIRKDLKRRKECQTVNMTISNIYFVKYLAITYDITHWKR